MGNTNKIAIQGHGRRPHNFGYVYLNEKTHEPVLGYVDRDGEEVSFIPIAEMMKSVGKCYEFEK